jgi:hypothetical protein
VPWKAEISQDVLAINIVNTWLVHNTQALTRVTVNMHIKMCILVKGKGCKGGSPLPATALSNKQAVFKEEIQPPSWPRTSV